MSRTHLRFVLPLVILVLAPAIQASAQAIPDPAANKELVIRDIDGTVIETLVPHGDRYDIFDSRRGGRPDGYMKRVGRQLMLYDRDDQPAGRVTGEMLPPDSDLSALAVVRDSLGRKIGTLFRY